MPISRTTLGLALAAAASAFAARPAAAADAFWGELDITLGDGVTSSFTRGDERHEFSFFGTAGTRVDVSVRRGAGAGVPPALRLLRPGGHEVPTGSRHGTAGLRGFELPYSGWFADTSSTNHPE
jgi:hypothetical protein